jgi:hypothetical protein
MSRLNNASRSFLRVVIAAALFSTSISHAEESTLASSLMTQAIHRSYPILAFAAPVVCKALNRADTPAGKLCNGLFIGPVFAFSGELKNGLVDANLIHQNSAAHLCAFVPPMALSFGINRMNTRVAPAVVAGPAGAAIAVIEAQPTLLSLIGSQAVISSRAAAMFQLGHSFRQSNLEHNGSNVTKLTGAGAAIAGVVATLNNEPLTSFVDYTGVSALYTFAYVAQESLVGLLQQLGLKMPELTASTLFQAAGAAGMAFFPANPIVLFASTAVHEAGTSSSIEAAMKAAANRGIWGSTSQFLFALAGYKLYVPGAQRTGAMSEIRSNAAVACFIPISFGLTYGPAKSLVEKF